MIIDYYPETIVLGYLNRPLKICGVVSTHVVLIGLVSAVWVEVNPDRVVSPSPQLDQQELHPIRTGTDEVPVEFGSTVRSCEVVNVLPVLSETASEIVYVPFLNDWDTGLPVLFVPPKFQLSAYGLVPPDAVSVKVTV